jgi:uncharacterized membrane protein (DUF2068 family)
VKERKLTKIRGIQLIALLKLIRGIMSFGLADIFYYISCNIDSIDLKNSFKFLLNNQDVILTLLTSFFQPQNSEVFFYIALVLLSLGLLRLFESIGLLFDISWALYSSIATGVIYISLTSYLLYEKFLIVTFIFFLFSALITIYLLMRCIKIHQT